MKLQSILLSAMIAVGSFAQAATDSSSVSTQAPKNIWAQESSSQGVRVSVMKPIVDFQLKKDGRSSEKYKMPQALGFSVGYASLPVQQLGWTVDAAYLTNLKMTDKTDSSSSVTWNAARVSGNLGYAFTDMLNAKGGINLTKMVSGELSSSFTPSLGFQAGVGVQFTPNLGLDVNYVYMNQTLSIIGTTVDAVMSGAEVALHGTF